MFKEKLEKRKPQKNRMGGDINFPVKLIKE